MLNASVSNVFLCYPASDCQMSAYDHTVSEPEWQQKWKEWNIYRFDPSSKREVYSIDTPPRYTSGALHLGHATGYPMLDFAARYRRMRGYNVFFPLCFDTNGMPVETATEKKHGITKFSVDRKTYLRLCSEYAHQFIDTMTMQFEMLGMSLDPSIYYQTDAPAYRRITQITFLRMLDKGLAYRGTFPVNWCVHCNTSLADAEVEREERKAILHHIKFPLKDGGHVTIATSRPELIGACQAVLFNGDDSRHSALAGRTAVLPIYDREVPLLEDGKVDMAFGTGAVMVCSYGDKEDAEWILKHKLPVSVIIDDMGNMNDVAGFLSGSNTIDARKTMVAALTEKGLLLKTETFDQSVGVCWRCATPVEIIETRQWFLKSVSFKEEIMEKAREIRWFPEFMKQRLRDWADSLTWDWVISRQRLFATPLPIWECAGCGHVVPATENQCYIDPLETPPPGPCPRCGSELKGSTDVFDTWMDSSVSVLYNTFWERDEKLFSHLFPMSLRGQAHEIIRTWAYYTILRSHLLLDEIPWNDIMITGFIMAPDKTPMHTHLGNMIDPVPIMKKYGADALRYFAATCSLGTDQAFREKDVVHGQRLCNKIWNIAKFCSSFEIKDKDVPRSVGPVDSWIISLYSDAVRDATAFMETYEFDRAMRAIEGFAWHDFADDYVEMAKQRAKDGDRAAIWVLRTISQGIVKMLAPLLPHVSEAVYQEFFKTEEKSIHLCSWPEPLPPEIEATDTGRTAVSIVHALRDWRAKNSFNGPISQITVLHFPDELKTAAVDIASACRAAKVSFGTAGSYRRAVTAIKPNYQYIGPRYREKAKAITDALKALDPAALSLNEDGSITLGGTSLEKEAFQLTTSYIVDGTEADALQVGDILLLVRK